MFFVVDIVKQMSYALICGGREFQLAKAAFGVEGCMSEGEAKFMRAQPEDVMPEAPGATIAPENTLMELPNGLVSRKAQFAPMILQALGSDKFKLESNKKPNSGLSDAELKEIEAKKPKDGDLDEQIFDSSFSEGFEVV